MEPTFPLTISEPGRADALIAAGLDGVTRSAAQKWLEEGSVTLNGKPAQQHELGRQQRTDDDGIGRHVYIHTHRSYGICDYRV